MLADEELKKALSVMMAGLPATTVQQIMFNTIDKTCNGYERSSTEVYEEMIREVIKIKKGE